MSDFLDIALSFPPVVFSFGLILVVLYWLTVVVGALDVDIVDVGGDAELDAGGGFWSAFGFGAVPFTVVLSLWITLGWIVTVLGASWIRGSDLFIPPAASGTAVLVAGIGVGMLGAKLLTGPLAKLFEDAPATAHADLVGKVCVVRTGTVTLDSGQAEITDEEGQLLLINVRRSPHEPDGIDDALFARHSKVVVFDYDEADRVFLVVPVAMPPEVAVAES
ncbi:YqiJ family protein [Glycomyces sp. TRM65418]|uniref:YqiJ family protein n=1 Tax=Glycomyces sp. TRM65418 TaxID=2867006 RepID=UPI001CE63433|nr:YqiJ family protein [Glycomyces sp. TRM65418]MCC3763899.1 YqiJ family protein [Glycomyces sp. TRM65418]QZD53602.1 YqiJ family protein [Glycomyces sp. TRM65418]